MTFKPTPIFRDYDGNFAAWENFKIVPKAIEPIVFYAGHVSEVRYVNVGSGDGLVGAVLADDGSDVLCIDTRPPAVVGAFKFLNLDPRSDEFFDLLTEGDVIVSRRKMHAFWSIDWTEKLNDSPVKCMVIESLDDDKRLFGNVNTEALYLSRNGWKTSISGNIITATR